MNDVWPLPSDRVISGTWFQVLLQLESLLAEGKGDWICFGSPSGRAFNLRNPKNEGTDLPKVVLSHPLWAFLFSWVDRKSYASLTRVDFLKSLMQLAQDQRRRVLLICPASQKALPSELVDRANENQSIVLREGIRLQHMADLVVRENIHLVLNTSSNTCPAFRESLQEMTKKNLLWVDAPKQANAWTAYMASFLCSLWFQCKEPFRLAQ